MPKSIEAQGVTVDEAIQTALNLLGLGRDSVEIEIIHHPRSGFIGIGARRAKVRATMREQVMKDGEEFDMAPDAGSRGRRRRRSDRRRTPRGGGEVKPREPRTGAPEVSAGRRNPPESRASGTPRGLGSTEGEGASSEKSTTEQRSQRSRGRGRRGGRGRGATERRNQAEMGPAIAADSALRDTPAVGPQPSGIERSATNRPRTQESPVPRRLDPEVLRARAHELTTELLAKMSVDAVVSVSIEEGGSIAVAIQASEDGAVLIGRRGTTLDALEHIVNRMTTGADPGARVRVSLDVSGYRERRKAMLSEVAARLKQHSISTLRRVQITPLSPYDRIVFQEALAGDDSVATRILGSGFYRRVLIIPRGHESDGSVPDEFNEEGQPIGYPAAGIDDDLAEEAAELSDVEPATGHIADSTGKLRGDDS